LTADVIGTVFDNLLYWKQQLRSVVRKRVPERYPRPVLPSVEANVRIAQLVRERRPSALGKMGAYELKAIRRYGSGGRLSSRERRLLYVNAGVFPPSEVVFRNWATAFMSVLGEMDFLAVWNNPGEGKIVAQYAPKATLMRATSLEPYYRDEPWSAELEGRKVLVISPFARTIEQQFANRLAIWPHNPSILPAMQLATLRCPLSDALVKSPFPDWFAALQAMTDEMAATDAEVVLIGAGAFSLPLAVAAKKQGRIGIHTGGWTQVLFGVKGAVWDKNPFISRFYNQNWVRPSGDERPREYKRVERGRYW
jgi:hypothetical protein